MSLWFWRLLGLPFISSCVSLLFLWTLFGTTLLHSLLCSMRYTSVLVLLHILRLFLQVMGPAPLYCWKKHVYSIEVNMSNNSNDVLPTSMPKLDVSGSNCVIFVLCFQMVVQGKGHFDGSLSCMVLSPPAQSSLTAVPASPTTTAASVVSPIPIVTQEAVDICVVQETWMRHVQLD